MFSEKLKKLRINHNLTQQQLADNLFIDRSLVAKYETNKAKPTKEIFQRIIDFFEVEPSYFDYKKVSRYIPITSDQLLHVRLILSLLS